MRPARLAQFFDAPSTTIKRIAFDGTAGSGAVGSVAVARAIQGGALADIAVRVISSLVGGSATLSLGVAANVEELIAATNASDLTAEKVWSSATPDVGAGPAIVDKAITADVILTIAVEAVTAGTLEIVFSWKPLGETGQGALA